MGFHSRFTVINETDVPIVFTPVGSVGLKADKRTLPIQRPFFLPNAIMLPKRGGFTLEPGGSKELIYDMDDINFSEIVVVDASGIRGQIVVNPKPGKNRYHAPGQKRFVVSDLDSLENVPEEVTAVALAAMEQMGL